jgi:opacity protein-like surface antigen
MSISLRKLAMGGAAVVGALAAAPALAAPQSGAQQLRLDAPQAAPAPAQEIAQTYVPLVGEVGTGGFPQAKGWYWTLGAGASAPQNRTTRVGVGPENNTNDFDVPVDVTYGGGFALDTGIGYDFGAIRTELTYGYSAPSVESIVSRDLSRSFSAGGKVNKNDIMLSAYWDVLTFSRFTPYIGGGIGYTDLSTVRGSSFDTGSYYNPRYHDKGLFGWQAKVGVSYALAYKWDVYAEGTFSGTGNPQFEGVNFSSYKVFGAKLGFRYRFSHPPVVVVAPAPAPEPAPMPMPAPEPAPAPAPIRGLW